MTFPEDILDATEAVLAGCRTRGWMVGTAESCTGGLIMAALTAVSGSSDAVKAGFVTYADESKTELVGVDVALIEAHGAVSAPVAEAMARGALDRAGLDLAIAVTGIAGPNGGSSEKPVGLVHFGLAWRAGEDHENIEIRAEVRRFGDIGRDNVRLETVRIALGLLQDVLG